jgi:alpha-L-glutamate ligase-like protein
VKLLRALRREGVLGINRRNHEYTLRWNPRRLYPTVDDKLATKRLCQAAGIPIPGLIAVARRQHDVRAMIGQIADLSEFVLKPAHGAMGNGILVVRAREGGGWRRAGGRRLTSEDLRYHAASIISGLYALGGQPDVAFVEELLEVHPLLAEISYEGVPDVRVIVHRGIPIMSMTRLPTRSSRGRANLHQGAIGAGVDLATGRILHAVLDGTPITRHPDSDRPVLGVVVPSFARVLEIAVAATDQTGLGYVGADVVVDAKKGPVVLELNARPGLAIQAANRAGLLPRLRAVSERLRPEAPLAERIGLGIEIARTARALEPA